MKTDASFVRKWRRLTLVIVPLASLLTLLLVARCTGREPVANTVDMRSAQVRANPVSGDAHAKISPQQMLAPTPDAAVMDELCGVNGPDLVRIGNETIAQQVSRLTQGAISHWQNTLVASEDPRRQAIGLALTNAQPQPTLGSEPSKDTAANNDLVLLAIDTSDPAIYWLALGECRAGEYDMAPGPCQGLSWEHWANIDPDNTTPWLWIAAKSDRAGDQQAVEAALAKASTAAHIGAYGSALTALALGALPGDVAPLEKAVAGADVTSILRVGTPLEILSLCSETAIQRPLRKQQCSAIATALANQGSTFIDLRLASLLADRLEFPEETRAALNRESKNSRAALLRSYPWRDSGGGSGFRCDTVLDYDGFIDSLQAAGGSERTAASAYAATGRAADRH